MRNNELLKYSGLTFQIIATLGVAIFIGIKADAYFKFRFPILTIVLPLILLVYLFYKIYKDSINTKK